MYGYVLKLLIQHFSQHVPERLASQLPPQGHGFKSLNSSKSHAFGHPSLTKKNTVIMHTCLKIKVSIKVYLDPDCSFPVKSICINCLI